MTKYGVHPKTEQISQDINISPADFGGWQVVNTGDTACTVNGVLLDPAGSVIGIDFTNLPPNVIWEESISIRFVAPYGANKRVVLTRLKYTSK